ncbi:MAG: putative Gingipain [Bacteroidetes bacterium]|nr:putative Gingipain [Bacteroidota bacterium]
MNIMGKYKFQVLFLLFCTCFSGINAQIIFGDGESFSKFNIKESLVDFSFSQEFNSLKLDRVELEQGSFFSLNMGEEFGLSNKIGCPQLPVYYKLIEVPFGAEVEVELSKIVIDEYALNEYGSLKLIPLQKSLSKSEDRLPFEINKDVYNSNKFFGYDLVSVEIIGQMGSTRIARLAISPIKYNPITNQIEFVKSFDAVIRFTNADYSSTIISKEKYNNQTSEMVKNAVLNGNNLSSQANQSSLLRPLKMVIVSDSIFANVLKPFIKWKKEKGIEVIEVYKGQPNVGSTTSSIKGYLKSLWINSSTQNPAPDYLLICGDIQQIPTFNGIDNPANPTDLYYAEYTDDYLPELFYGRFSAQTIDQMQSIINKTIKYEKYDLVDKSYLNKTLLVAGKETNPPAPTCVNGQMNYLKNKYLSVNPLVDTLVYYNPSSGNYSTQIKDSITKNGYSLINYSAHCDQTGWSIPSYNVTSVNNNVNNIGKYSFYINNCCLSSKYNESECFAEALLRANDKGAIGVIGGSNYTYWFEDFYWAVGAKTPSLNANYNSSKLGAYDRWFHTKNESANDWRITQGQIVQGGNLSVTQMNSNYSNYYWEIYNLMGDPSLSPYVGIPITMQNNIPESIPIGSTNLSFQVSPNALVAITENGNILGVSQGNSNGIVNIDFQTPIIDSGYIKVVITNQFSKPIIDSIYLFAPNYPEINFSSIKFTDNNGQEVLELKNDKEYYVSFDVSNLGSHLLDSVVIMSKSTESLNVIDSSYYIGLIGSKSNVTLTNALKFKIRDGVKDRTIIDFNIIINGENNYSRIRKYLLESFSPSIEIKKLSILPSNDGYSAGDTIQISFEIQNKGRNVSSMVYVKLDSLSSFVSNIGDSIKILNPINPNSSDNVVFNLVINPIMAPQELLNLRIGAIAGLYYDAKKYSNIVLGGNIETFETNDFNFVPWQNDINRPWIIDSNTTNVFEGNYSARSSQISNNQKTTLKINSSSIGDDSISFYIRYSTEADYDIVSFYIDEGLVAQYSGSINWTKMSYPVGRGNHEFKWEYEKDNSSSSGYDAVWIDNITFPLIGNVTSVNSITNKNDNIIIYPNPANDEINIKYIKEGCSIKIINSIGRLFFSKDKISSEELLINISKLPSGLYYVCTQDGFDISTKKLIIAR